MNVYQINQLQTTINDDDNELWLSPISIWETLLLAEKGRIILKPTPEHWIQNSLLWSNIDCTWPFLTLPDVVFYFLTFIERSIATALNFRSMYKKIFPSIILKNETKTFFVIEELDRTITHTVFCLLNKSSD